DLAAANGISNTVSILLNTGAGAFQAPPSYATGKVAAMALIDFNGDGHLDLAAANGAIGGPGAVRGLLGAGGGAFLPPVHYTVGEGARAVAAADLDGDGVLDLVTGNSASATVSVLMGNGDGTFRAAVHYVAGLAPSAVAAVDLDADGDRDLVVTNGV